MRQFIIALQFLTWFTVRNVEIDDDSFARSLRFYPLVGLVIGAVLAGVFLLGSLFLPPGVTAVLLLAAGVLISGGLHLDGFMDTMDGLFSGRSRERVLEIMKDSRVGAHSVIALVLLFLLKYSLYAGLIGTVAWTAAETAGISGITSGKTAMLELLGVLLAAPLVGRWGITWAICRYPYARQSGLGSVYGGRVGAGDLVLVTVYTLLLLLGLLQLRGVVVAGAALLFTLGFCRLVSGRLGGMTGDTYGAVCELLEVVVLLVALLLCWNNWLPGWIF